ncbi:MAG TPA: glycoside hydrolase family 13 protein [Candidatus Dormibacteraeota bacterium]|nr:glycoside hydrolase family 13 protein [Candidatus Dormibacteraeota bacterium]
MNPKPALPGRADRPWWRDAVIYQVYIRSFADGSGDGIGDVAGIRSRLPYLRDLGVDAIWINPWYVSPQADAGYDVADYRRIDPRLGTLEEAEALLEEAHEHGIRVILDIVPNHTSDRHPWFQEALAAGPGSRERERYVFRTGRGPGGGEPPTNWPAAFGGPAWQRVAEADGSLGEWYLHLFAPEQPDLNWENPEVMAEFDSVLRFWFDRGVDGFRIDVANGLVKDPAFPDVTPRASEGPPFVERHPAWDQEGVHEVYRRWRRIADAYRDDPRVFVGEIWVESAERLARYLRPDELHTAFNFDFLLAPWDAAEMRRAIDTTTAAIQGVGAPATWVLSNHDVIRHVTRYGRPEGKGLAPAGTVSTDLELGTRRARAAALLILALPGNAYVYQGDELGLWEVEDLPEEVLQDPLWVRSGHRHRGRDGCRVPLPWSGDATPFGFSASGSAAPWLPQPAAWRELTADAEATAEGSMLTLYRAALRQRRGEPALGDGGFRWLEAPAGVLALSRDPGFACVVNLSSESVSLPPHEAVLLASAPLEEGAGEVRLPGGCAVWLRTA